MLDHEGIYSRRQAASDTTTKFTAMERTFQPFTTQSARNGVIHPLSTDQAAIENREIRVIGGRTIFMRRREHSGRLLPFRDLMPAYRP